MRYWPKGTTARSTGLVLLAAALVLPAGALGFPHSSAAEGYPLPTGAFAPRNVTFTGNLSTDFGGGPFSVNENTSSWGSGNNLSAFYAAYNGSELFLGFQEVITGNSLMVFVGNAAGGSLGTYNLSGLNAWGRSLTFTSPVTDLAAVYLGAKNGNLSGYGTYQILTPPSDSNTSPSDRLVASASYFAGANNTVEIGIPLATIFPVNSQLDGNVTVSAFVVGSSGSWVGTGMPYAQTGAYNQGGSQASFLVNDTFRLPLRGLPLAAPEPLNVAIVFNDHQPVYEVAGNSTYNLPWTEAHATAEYIEQPLILQRFPSVNITYELSGSLLWQLQNITNPGFNDSFIQGAYLPFSSLNTSRNASLLANLTGDWFSVPGYVYAFPEPAAHLYQQLQSQWSSGKPLNATQYEDAKVLWFLYEISTDLVEGRLGSAWTSPTIWALHNQTSFTQADLGTILRYSQWLTGQVIPAFRSIEWGNASGSDNTELFTSPFYHPLTPLLLTPTISGPSGTLTKGIYTTDVLAQMNLSRDQFDRIFGNYPRGLYASEAAVSEAMVPEIAMSGAQWSVTDEWTLQQSGVPALAWGDTGNSVASMEDLYTPYVVQGANGTSTTMFFRDAPLSNNWAFNYGNLPTATAVADILNYLKAINGSIPVGDHPRTLVTLMLDGENWQFMSPFADDGIPFLQDLYLALEQNRSAVHTMTPSQFLDSLRSTPWQLPSLSSVATGTWNQGSGSAAPYQSNPSLTQWSGYSAQDWMWADLDQVRQQVVQFQQKRGLVQLENLTAFDQNLTAATPEGNLTRAWYGIYNAEGSDWYFQMAPWTIAGANTVPFNLTFQGDLAYALSELHPGLVTPPRITSFTAAPDPVSVNHTTLLNVTAASGSPPYSYTYLGLPPGCATANTSALNCTPTVAGNYSITATVKDSGGSTATSKPVVLTVRPLAVGAPTISTFTVSAPNVTLGGSVYLNVTASGGVVPYTYSYTGLPAGCASNNSSRLLCTPTATGNYSVTVRVDGANGMGNVSPPVTFSVVKPVPHLPLLTSVSVTPGTTTLALGSTQNFTASVRCGNASCPSGVLFQWSLSSAMGTLNRTNGSTVSFWANNGTGNVTLEVVASRNGTSVSANTSISIYQNRDCSPCRPLFPPILEYGIALVVLVVVVGLLILVLVRRRRSVEPPPPPPPPQDPAEPAKAEASPDPPWKEG